ncbi:hypothetical protein BU26DRAFT_553551 [Trematosphaeria pertusa]|uniref:Uncharacterized protein n=1 Tax=Trematosphaeria pertusa TaxID=390896 RepID=A0A6A6I5C4_9PLEO|nr:uncharacterized protein BU26DRAFT_553551 [Trematosphaeria pertusa]KAF2245734.1 hypothetical protein BU26DRAFT_553551 [Trematosphaeria pertusa]
MHGESIGASVPIAVEDMLRAAAKKHPRPRVAIRRDPCFKPTSRVRLSMDGAPLTRGQMNAMQSARALRDRRLDPDRRLRNPVDLQPQLRIPVCESQGLLRTAQHAIASFSIAGGFFSWRLRPDLARRSGGSLLVPLWSQGRHSRNDFIPSWDSFLIGAQKQWDYGSRTVSAVGVASNPNGPVDCERLCCTLTARLGPVIGWPACFSMSGQLSFLYHPSHHRLIVVHGRPFLFTPIP